MEYWTYNTEFKQVEEVAILFKSLDEAKEHALKSYISLGMDIEDWNQLTSYFKFKVNE